MKRVLVLALFLAWPGMALFLAWPGMALPAGPNGECTCSYAGGDVIEGQTACIKTAKGMVLARCERVLNNTSWKFLDQPCPTTQRISDDHPSAS